MYAKIGLEEDSDINFEQYKEQLNNLIQKDYFAKETGQDQQNRPLMASRRDTMTLSNLDSRRTLVDMKRNQSLIIEEDGLKVLSKNGSARSILSKEL